jgi:phosphohistidine swiveling domain-containing protein
MEKIIFEKNYTRDTSLFLQDIWGRNQSVEVLELIGKKNPHLPGIIHYVNKGSVEIWEHNEATEWLMDAILEKNTSDPDFFYKMMEEHKVVLNEIKPFWDKKILETVEELGDLAALVKRGFYGFNFMYRTALDERSPKEMRDAALEMRKNDVFFSQNDVLLQSSLSSIFPQLKGYENYIFATELVALPSESELHERKKNFIVIDGTEHYIKNLSDFEAANPNYHFKQEIVDEQAKELKGQSAFKGKVTGVVKLVHFRSELHKVEQGDILVSPMTTPDLLPAMEKASAFVTDEGGITCHAAIVAREMKKPCIIGTKVATKVLKDGDLVEVDAENGVVRIIS